MLFVGLSNGHIFYYKKKNLDSKLIETPGKDLEICDLTSPQAHRV